MDEDDGDSIEIVTDDDSTEIVTDDEYQSPMASKLRFCCGCIWVPLILILLLSFLHKGCDLWFHRHDDVVDPVAKKGRGDFSPRPYYGWKFGFGAVGLGYVSRGKIRPR